MKETSIPLQLDSKQFQFCVKPKTMPNEARKPAKSRTRSVENDDGDSVEGASPSKSPRKKERVNGRPSQRTSPSQLQHRPDALPQSAPWRNVPSKMATRAERPPCGVSEKASRTEGRIAASRSAGMKHEQSESHVDGAQLCKNRCNSAHDLPPTGHLPAGMENKGNMCYANSSIQLLFYCKWCALRS